MNKCRCEERLQTKTLGTATKGAIGTATKGARKKNKISRVHFQLQINKPLCIVVS
jgi:hypothetical protein